MGWTGCYGIKTVSEKKRELDRQYDGGSIELVKSSMVGNTYYCAYRVKKTGDIRAGVAIHHMNKGEFCYKDMTESMGPCEDHCPESILKLLTPTDSEYAKEWRERCWKRIRQKKEEAKFKKEALVGYAVQIIDAAGNKTWVQKITESRMTRGYVLHYCIVTIKERAEEILNTVKECYEHCNFRSVDVQEVKRLQTGSMWMC